MSRFTFYYDWFGACVLKIWPPIQVWRYESQVWIAVFWWWVGIDLRKTR